jgi:hypothetical protein
MKTETKTHDNKTTQLFTERDMIECYVAAVINTTRAMYVNPNVTVTAEDYVKSLFQTPKQIK